MFQHSNKNLKKEIYKTIIIIYLYFIIMESRVSATGLKSVELDELTTDQIIINNEGLQYLHKYNILLPTVTEGF